VSEQNEKDISKEIEQHLDVIFRLKNKIKYLDAEISEQTGKIAILKELILEITQQKK
jgi:peptidoglycan hydrolase CwlO-like protein